MLPQSHDIKAELQRRLVAQLHEQSRVASVPIAWLFHKYRFPICRCGNKVKSNHPKGNRQIMEQKAVRDSYIAGVLSRGRHVRREYHPATSHWFSMDCFLAALLWHIPD